MAGPAEPASAGMDPAVLERLDQSIPGRYRRHADIAFAAVTI